MKEEKLIKILLPKGEIKECTVAPSRASPWKISLSGWETHSQEFSGDDLFEALGALRRELEKSDAQLLCVGARPDVWPSGMSRSTSGGRKVYATCLGSPAVGGLLDIFEFSEPKTVGSIAQQEAFHKTWVESLK